MNKKLLPMLAVIAFLSMIIGMDYISRSDIRILSSSLTGKVVDNAASMPSATLDDVDNMAFVKASYIYFLDRPATRDELNYGLNFLMKSTKEDFISKVLYDLNVVHAYDTDSMGDMEFLKFLYHHFLKRSADPELESGSTLTYYLSLLSSGNTREDIVNTYFIYNNPELRQKLLDKIDYLRKNGAI